MVLKTNRYIGLTAVCLLFVVAASSCAGAPVVSPTAAPTGAPTAAPTGRVIQGVVYNDLNQNGQIDPAEKPLEAVSVFLSSCGPDQTRVTGADGAFEFSGLQPAASTCTVLAERSGWTFSGSYPNLGYPMVVPLAADRATVISLYLAPAQPAGAVNATPPAVGATPAPTATPLVTLGPLLTNTPLVSPALSAPTLTAINININCLYGPAIGYDTVGVLVKGLAVPIEASNPDGTWWEIENPWSPGTSCWVSGAFTLTSGDTSQLPKVNAPTGIVSKIRVSATPVIHGTCGTANLNTLTGLITANGPAFVVYHWEIESPTGYNNHALPSQTVNIPYNTTVTVTQDFSRDCGDYVGLLVITSPNSKTGQTSWRVTSP